MVAELASAVLTQCMPLDFVPTKIMAVDSTTAAETDWTSPEIRSMVISPTVLLLIGQMQILPSFATVPAI